MKLSDYVAKFIADIGVDTLFTIPGGGCIFLSDSFEREKRINVIGCHHEQACAISAEGYARIKNDIGVCLVTSGPGGTNALTGALCSFQDSMPIIFISGNVNKDLTTNYTGLNLRQLGDQEFNISDMASKVTKFAVQVNDENKIKYYLEKAVYEAKNGRPGPVWIDIPLDISTKEIDPDNQIGFNPLTSDKAQFDNLIKLAIEKLNKSKKPMIIVGNGVRLSGAVKLLNDIIETYKIPVITSLNGNDCVSNEYKYFCGRFGLIGDISANKLIQEADFVLSLGSRLYIRQIGYNFKSFCKNAYKVYVDIDNGELNKPTLFPDIKINVDVKYFLKEINEKINISKINAWRIRCELITLRYRKEFIKKIKEKKELSIYYVIHKLNAYINKLPIVTSNGSANVVTMQTLKLKNDQRLFTNKGAAPMGYGLPAAIGAYFANKTPIICIEGDGSLHMNIQELQTMMYNNIPIKLLIINNQGYLSIKQTQDNLCNKKRSLSDVNSGLLLPNYSELAWAYNIQYNRIKTNKDIKTIFSDVFSEERLMIPEIIEIFTDPEEIFEPKVLAKFVDNKIIPGELNNINWLT